MSKKVKNDVKGLIYWEEGQNGWKMMKTNDVQFFFLQKNIEKCRKGGIMMEKLQIIGKEPEMDKKIKNINYFEFVLWEMMQKGQVIRERAKIDKNEEN
jgi:hypothetical protein